MYTRKKKLEKIVDRCREWFQSFLNNCSSIEIVIDMMMFGIEKWKNILMTYPLVVASKTSL